MNKFKTFLLLLVSFILQTSIFSKISIFNANINILIPAIVSLSQILRGKTSNYSALIVGLIEDFLLTSFIGIRALSYYLMSYIISNESFKVGKDKKSGFILSFGFSIFNFVLVTGIYYILGNPTTDLGGYFPVALLIEAFLNAIIYLIYNKIIRKIMYVPTYRI